MQPKQLPPDLPKLQTVIQPLGWVVDSINRLSAARAFRVLYVKCSRRQFNDLHGNGKGLRSEIRNGTRWKKFLLNIISWLIVNVGVAF